MWLYGYTYGYTFSYSVSVVIRALILLKHANRRRAENAENLDEGRGASQVRTNIQNTCICTCKYIYIDTVHTVFVCAIAYTWVASVCKLCAFQSLPSHAHLKK